MDDNNETGSSEPKRPTSRMPEDSVLFEKVIPALLIGLGIVMFVLIVLATGILIGVIPYR
ncbi:MAG: hypothetical protein ACE5E7_03400 [Anaerolineae bacterium]